MSTSQFDTGFPTSIYLFRRERDLRPFCLEQIEGAGAPQRIPLSKKEMVIGRSHDADIPLSSQRASRHHAFFMRQGTDYAIRDNDSPNGIFLNGIKVHSATLRDGDVIQIADSAFIFHEG
ncbi:MAG: FHA domain-containing protein [Verrucomicrobia bacterium]|nr:FHA domain-containing protein [Verrucomicrobiota bacterium]